MELAKITEASKDAQPHLCDHKGLGLSQQARFGENGSDPDRNTARQVLEPSIGTLLASYRCDNGSWRNPHTLTSMPCLPSTERLAKQDVDG